MASAYRPSSAATVSELLAHGGHSFSFEFFPPKTDDGERILFQAIRELEGLRPTFVSVTYGAGGTTRDRTVRITERIAEETTLLPVAHLTCVGASVADLRSVIGQYAAAGIRNVLALRGDPPGGPGTPWVQHDGGFEHADELVALVRSLGDFSVGVAAFPEGHPESPSLEHDARVLLAKQQAGAEFAVTQLFFQTSHYVALLQRARAVGVTIPILPGIMPLTNVAQIDRFSQLSGTDFPADLAARFRAVADDADAVHALGVESASQLCQELLDAGAPGLHFFTLNRSTSTREVYEALGLAALA
ncbi:MAG TPA: methylenetetrahydrofolate reductase [NAD(P)H] [Candidatus Nanopelagicales bacterium]|nr:methylenetetrahydrofolate reductase [NAD(P)H] [Candidatus Nanopelagicales bacterium]